MKKIILGFSGLIVLTFFILFALSAQTDDKKVEKKSTESSESLSQNPSYACCSASKVANCCSAKSGPVNCELSKCKEGKCDQVVCQVGKCTQTACLGRKCDQATCQGGRCTPSSCKTNCQNTSISMVGSPMNCNR